MSKQAPAPPITQAEAARRLGLDQVADRPERIVKAMARRGDLVGVRVSKWILIDPASVDRYLGRTTR